MFLKQKYFLSICNVDDQIDSIDHNVAKDLTVYDAMLYLELTRTVETNRMTSRNVSLCIRFLYFTYRATMFSSLNLSIRFTKKIFH